MSSEQCKMEMEKKEEYYEIKLTAEVAISCDINFRQNRRKGCELAIPL